jgi:hypothetical protein
MWLSAMLPLQLCFAQLRLFLIAWASHQPPSTPPTPVVAAALRIGNEICNLASDAAATRDMLKYIARCVNHINHIGHIKQLEGAGTAGTEAPVATDAADVTNGDEGATVMTTAPEVELMGGIAVDTDTRRSVLESKRAYEADRRRRKAAEEDAARAAAEASSRIARGSPPPLRGGWRTPAWALPTLLAIWDFLGTFADILWLPPIPLARLDAAICPESSSPNAADEASSFLLRDIHCAFLRTLEGRAGKGAPVPHVPVCRSNVHNIIPCVGDHHWQVRLVKILEGRAYDAAVLSEPHAFDALNMMRAGDYLDLSITHRLAIINLLISIALQTEMLRCEIHNFRPNATSTQWLCFCFYIPSIE